MTPKKAALVKQLLVREYGRPAKRPAIDPLDQLVGTILSQNTTDTNSDRAFQKLKERFPVWDKALSASPETVARAIHCGGLAEIKSHRILRVLRTIREREGDLSLQRIRSMPVAEALAYLTDLDGVGIKTACCVLLFSCGRPVMPVDTHVYRVSQRLGLLGGSVPIQKAHLDLHKLIAPEDRLTMHLLLIQHGRQTCHALKPACAGCVLAKQCPSCGMERMDGSKMGEVGNAVGPGLRCQAAPSPGAPP